MIGVGVQPDHLPRMALIEIHGVGGGVSPHVVVGGGCRDLHGAAPSLNHARITWWGVAAGPKGFIPMMRKAFFVQAVPYSGKPLHGILVSSFTLLPPFSGFEISSPISNRTSHRTR